MTSVNGLAEFYAEQQTPGGRCGVAKALAALPDKDAALLREALAAPDLQGKAIARWLDKHGQPTSSMSVQRHRRKDCHCE